MPVISLPYAYLEELVGSDRDTILSKIPMFGADIERIEADHADIEFFANRPDLFSTEGVARAMRGFLGIETGLPEYRVEPSGMSFSIDPGLSGIRPYLGSAVIRNVSFNEESIVSLMGLQESLHWAVGRGRGKVAIGIHDLDSVKPPFRYLAADPDTSFVPLDFDREMTMREILTEHPKGRDYAHLVEPYSRYPLIVDANGDVLSFPPIINGELTRVTTSTANILLDTTGTDQRAVMTAVNIICTAFAENGADIESITIGDSEVPTLAPVDRVVDASECFKLLGLSLTDSDMVTLLEAMRYGAVPEAPGRIRVRVPCYRADILHDWDIFEDVGIAYGYGKIEPLLPPTFTSGRGHPYVRMMNMVREILCGMGYLEVMPFTLTNDRILFGMMNRDHDGRAMRVMHPITEDHTHVRCTILPLLMETLQMNVHRELPQRLFAVGDVVLEDHTRQSVAAVSMHPESDFSEIYALSDVLKRELNIPCTVTESDDPAFISGRRADIVVGERVVGVFGEIYPAVLTAFQLEQPVAGLELDLTAVRECLSPPGTP